MTDTPTLSRSVTGRSVPHQSNTLAAGSVSERLVTGTANGMGHATAHLLAEHDTHACITDPTRTTT